VKVLFLADADLNKAIVSGVLRREPTVDFLTASRRRIAPSKDPEVLALAARSSECSSHTMLSRWRDRKN
jgi:hypothetical protein